jgi:TatA/E family protein of Tat protein translocase
VFNIGPTELIVILIVALIVFGPKRLPEIGRTLGRSLNEFRRASNDLRRELEMEVDQTAQPTPGANLPSTPSQVGAAPAAADGQSATPTQPLPTDQATSGGATAPDPEG